MTAPQRGNDIERADGILRIRYTKSDSGGCAVNRAYSTPGRHVIWLIDVKWHPEVTVREPGHTPHLYSNLHADDNVM